MLSGALDDHDLVVAALEADLGARHVVEDDRVRPLALELLVGPLEACVRLRSEADDRLVLTALRGERGEDVLGRLQVELEAAAALAVDLLAGGPLRAEVGR